MEKKLVKKETKTALHQLALRLSVTADVLQSTLKATAFKECKTNEQFVAAVIVANTYKLNPILKEMSVFVGKGGGVVPIIMVDGFISMVNRQPDFDGVELIENEGDGGDSGTDVESVTAKFYLKSKSHPVMVTEYMKECYNGTREPWKKWPRRMLRHKAYIQGARVAFGFSGVYDQDEAARIVEAELIGGGKPDVEAPKALPIDSPEKNESPYKKMLEQFEISKEILGDEKYYIILEDNGYKHANEIKKVAEGNNILNAMSVAADDKAK